MRRAAAWRSRFAREGWLVAPGALAGARLGTLIAAFPDGGSRRDCLDLAPVRGVVRSRPIRALVRAILGPRAFAVRALLIDKRADADWALPPHRDTAVAVVERREAAGFSGWSLKQGVVHALAPPAVLAHMVAVRVNLDASDDRSGALRVRPRSHLDLDRAPAARERALPVRRGDVVLLRPLCLHGSAKSHRTSPRRVLHLEFAARELPGGLRWRDRVA